MVVLLDGMDIVGVVLLRHMQSIHIDLHGLEKGPGSHLGRFCLDAAHNNMGCNTFAADAHGHDILWNCGHV